MPAVTVMSEAGMLDMLDQASNVIAVLVPMGAVLWAIWKRIGGVLSKLDHSIESQDELKKEISQLKAHQHEINGGIVQHMTDDVKAFSELKAAIAHVEGRLDEQSAIRWRGTT